MLWESCATAPKTNLGNSVHGSNDGDDTDTDYDSSIISFAPDGRLRIVAPSKIESNEANAREGPSDMKMAADRGVHGGDDKYSIIAGNAVRSDGNVIHPDGDATHSGKQRMSAKARRDAKRAAMRAKNGAGKNSSTWIEETGANEIREECEAEFGDEQIDAAPKVEHSLAAVAAPVPLKDHPDKVGNSTSKRGKHGKQKKMRERYADQDEEERKLMLSLLGSAGRSKAEIAREVAREKAAEKQRRAEEAERRRTETKERAQQKVGSSFKLESVGELGDEHEEANPQHLEMEAIMNDLSIQSLPEEERKDITNLDLLTGIPNEKDELSFALPVCAPYTALTGYKFRLKLTPGTQKKGKGGKQAIGLFCGAGFSATQRECELIRAIRDEEVTRTMIGKVKVIAPGGSVKSRSKKSHT